MQTKRKGYSESYKAKTTLLRVLRKFGGFVARRSNRGMYTFSNGDSTSFNIFDLTKSVIDSQWIVLDN